MLNNVWKTALITTSLSWLAMTATAGAVTFTPLFNYGDADFIHDKNTGLFQEDWVAEARGGRSGLVGDPELFLNNWTTNDSWHAAAQGQFLWEKNTAYDFEISYAGGSVNYTFGGVSLFAGDLTELGRFVNGNNALMIRTRSDGNDSSITLSNLAVNGITYDGVLASNDPNAPQVNYLQVTGFSGDFTLTGQAVLDWAGTTPPTGSRLAFQVKAGEQKRVPEPTSALVLVGLALGGSGFLKRRRDR